MNLSQLVEALNPFGDFAFTKAHANYRGWTEVSAEARRWKFDMKTVEEKNCENQRIAAIATTNSAQITAFQQRFITFMGLSNCIVFYSPPLGNLPLRGEGNGDATTSKRIRMIKGCQLG